MRRVWGSFALFTLLSFTRCVGDSGGAGVDAGPDVDPTGSEGHACFPNKTCDTGLTCISGVCVDLDSGTNDASSSNDAEAGAAGITFQAVKSGTSGSPLTIASFDPGTAPNRLLVVGVSLAPNGLQAGMTVTFGGMGLQEATGAAGTANGNNNPAGYYTCTSRIFYMVNPTSGPANVVVTFTGLAQPVYAVAGAVAFSGVNQSTPIQNATQKSGTGTSMSVSVGTGTGHMTLANGCSYAGSVTPTSGVQRWNVVGNADGVGSTIASASSTSTHTWTQSNGYAWVASGIDIVPAP